MLTMAILLTIPGLVRAGEVINDQGEWIYDCPVFSDFDSIDWYQTNKLENLGYSSNAVAVAKIAATVGTNDLTAILEAVSRSESDKLHVVAGLLLWTQQGGVPKLRDDNHYALHFIYGAAAESISGLGDEAAIWKETRDRARGGVFNTNQMNAAQEGASWMRQ